MSDISDIQVDAEIVSKIVDEKIVDKPAAISKNDVMIEITKIAFSQLVENFLNQNKDNSDALRIKLTPNIQKFFLLLCKEKPGFFADVELTLTKIILDDKINIADIPEIIILVTKVYEIIKTDKGVPQVDPYELIKTLLHMIFVLYIETNNIQNKALTTDILNIIDVSIDLIKLTAIKMPTLGCFKSMFK
jgi:hypothetical protein